MKNIMNFSAIKHALANMQQFSGDAYPAPSSAVSNEQTVVLEKLASESRIRTGLHLFSKMARLTLI